MGTGMGWGSVTLTQPAPVVQAQQVLYMNGTCSMGIRRCPENIGRQHRWQTFLLYSTCGVDPQKKKKFALQKLIHICQNHIPYPKPMPTDSPEASGPRKCKLSTKATTNGDPEVEQKKKKLEAKKQSTKLAPTKKHSLTPVNTTTKPTAKPAPAPRPRRPSIEVEEIEDELDRHASVPPRNPRHILEATNRSDDDVDTTPPPQKSTKKPVVTKRCPSVEVEEVFDESDHHTSVPPRNLRHILEAADGSDDDKEDLAPDGKEEGEVPEESDEAELGM